MTVFDGFPPGSVATLLLDADDTLWENNIYFDAVLTWLEREARAMGFADRAVHRVIDRFERQNILRRGYGYDSFQASLLSTVALLLRQAGREDRHGALARRARAHVRFLRSHPMVLLRGVEPCLPVLARSLTVIVVTKGNPDDQMGKVRRSGLERLFHGVEVVAEKSPRAYKTLLARLGLDPERTVMAGNAPKSDINAAKKAGLRTVYIPHPSTWHFELEPILPSAPATIVVDAFDQLPAALGIAPPPTPPAPAKG